MATNANSGTSSVRIWVYKKRFPESSQRHRWKFRSASISLRTSRPFVALRSSQSGAQLITLGNVTLRIETDTRAAAPGFRGKAFIDEQIDRFPHRSLGYAEFPRPEALDNAVSGHKLTRNDLLPQFGRKALLDQQRIVI